MRRVQKPKNTLNSFGCLVESGEESAKIQEHATWLSQRNLIMIGHGDDDQNCDLTSRLS